MADPTSAGAHPGPGARLPVLCEQHSGAGYPLPLLYLRRCARTGLTNAKEPRGSLLRGSSSTAVVLYADGRRFLPSADRAIKNATYSTAAKTKSVKMLMMMLVTTASTLMMTMAAMIAAKTRRTFRPRSFMIPFLSLAYKPATLRTLWRDWTVLGYVLQHLRVARRLREGQLLFLWLPFLPSGFVSAMTHVSTPCP